MESYSLYELNTYIKQVFALNLSEPVWVKGEISQIKNSRGHSYIHLIQKDDKTENILAEAQSVLWAGEYGRLKIKLGTDLDKILTSGMNVLLKVKVNFHQRYGLKFMIQDVEPSYTLGKLELKRLEIIKKLKALDLIDKNKERKLPEVIQKIAVISSAAAAGYIDFIQQLKANPFSYKFKISLFPSALQGEMVEQEMLRQFEKIATRKDEFDCVVIIRGGGSKLDLGAFDNFNIAENISHFPLPVLIGIGHEIDTTILDIVAYKSLKTPTAVAEFIINRNMQFEARLLNYAVILKDEITAILKTNDMELERKLHALKAFAKNKTDYEKNSLLSKQNELTKAILTFFSMEKTKITTVKEKIRLLDPQTVLKRGYSMTKLNGKIITSVKTVKDKDKITTVLKDGEFDSVVSGS